jgi:hypothetical protein
MRKAANLAAPSVVVGLALAPIVPATATASVVAPVVCGLRAQERARRAAAASPKTRTRHSAATLTGGVF